jgi:CubicO group peptidase (beta-lactamase class C family)
MMYFYSVAIAPIFSFIPSLIFLARTTCGQEVQFPLASSGTPLVNHTHFNTTIQKFIDERSIPGIGIAILKSNKIVYEASHGFANISERRAVTVHDRFRLASVSKSITAIAIMTLVQDGKLNLTNTVFGRAGVLKHKYGDEPYSPWVEQITVQHLLEHSSGFVNEDMCGTDCDPTWLGDLVGLDQWQLVGTLLDKYNQSHAPGTFADYSNFGYFILGRIVESVSRSKKYENYVQNHVLSKIGVTDMRLARDEPRDHEVSYYDFEDPDAPYHFHVSRRDSVGAWIATASDLVKITKAVSGFSSNGQLLTQDARDQMFRRSTVINSTYAKGFSVEQDDDGNLLSAQKDGGYPGTTTFIYIDFVNQTSFAIVANTVLKKDERFHGVSDMRDLGINLTASIG